MNRKFCVALATLAIVMFASSAFAGLMIDVKAQPGTGYVVLDDGKTVKLDVPGSVISFEVFATISGANGNVADELFQSVSGGLKQVFRAAGNTSALSLPATEKGYLAPYNTLANSAVAVTDTLIGTEGLTNGTNAWFPRSSSQIANAAAAETRALGMFNLTARADGTIDAAGLISSVNFVKPGSALSNYSYKIDNSAGNLAGITVGAPVNISAVPIPEPATLVLLGMGALALVFIRRRK